MKVMTADLEVGKRVSTAFAVRSVMQKRSKNNKDYIVFDLYDRTGSVRGYLWDDLDKGVQIQSRCFVMLRGYVKSFIGLNIIQIKQIRLARSSEIDPCDFGLAQEIAATELFGMAQPQLWPEQDGEMFESTRKVEAPRRG